MLRGISPIVATGQSSVQAKAVTIVMPISAVGTRLNVGMHGSRNMMATTMTAAVIACGLTEGSGSRK